MQNRLALGKLNNRWSRLPVNYRGAIVIAIPALCMAGTLGAWAWSRQVGLELRQRIDHTKDIIIQSDRLLNTLVNAETGIRGYDLTGRKNFLDPYNQAIATLPATLDRLEELVDTDPRQKALVTRIEAEIVREIEVLRVRLGAIERNAPESGGIALLEEGKRVMDGIRASMHTLQSRERDRLNKQKQHLASVREITTSIQWLTAWVSALAYLGAVYLFNQLNRELEEREQQLSESTTLIDAITTNVVDGVITVDRRGRIETVNRAAARMFGYEPAETIGENLVKFLTGPGLEDREREEKAIALHDCLIHFDRSWQTSGYRKSGESFPIEISLSDTRLDHLLIAIVRDISESESAKNKLRERAEELTRLSTTLTAVNIALEKQNQELDKFAYVVSHDLKAPLRAIASLSEWIEEDLGGRLSSENQRQMELLRGRVHRLEALINGLLDYSRLGKTPIPLEIVDVARVLEDTIEFIEPPKTFTIEIVSPLPAFLAKKLPLEQVFLHLIDNAIRHHDRPDGRVRIAAVEQERFYLFSVSDDGPGIDSTFHERIFAIFQTLLPRDVKESTGIGLSLAKKIVELEGGKIWIDSKLGQGATFYFTWPKVVPG
jgi:PAS domain S-box-containing protein